MTTEWLSESDSSGAKSVILLGPLSKDQLVDQSMKFPLGVLWFSPPVQQHITLPSNVENINRSNNTLPLKSALETFMLLDYDTPPSVKVSNKIEEDNPTEYTKILDLVIAEIDSTMRARRTRSETGFLRQRQIFTNLAGYLTKRLPNEWNSLGQGKLAVVVGAGPSLDVTLTILNSNIPNPIIIAADSSLKALKHAGMDPDFVVSIDPQKTFDSCSDPDYTPGIAILSSQSHDSWRKNWGESCAYLSGRVITEDWLAEKGISKTNHLVINNAGLSALAFADFLNTSAILTIGLDLAGGGDGQDRYAEITNRSHIQVHASHYHSIPGNYNETVPTPFLSDWRETSDYCKKISNNKTVINFNDRGAKLEGATLVHPKQFQELKEALNESIAPFIPLDKGLLKLRKCLSGFGLNQLLVQLATLCDKAWSDLCTEDTSENTSNLNALRSIFANRDIASLFGDFAFSIMPILSPEKHPSSQEIKKAFSEFQDLLWRLEDSIIECNPKEEFLLRFFTEKFN
ncbi:MAG: DUF115 domain-containing protein [Opitutales bacterium]|nr:DUF115 domain-containing protein [Opitutales bacterium]